jgi:hypothetical protein
LPSSAAAIRFEMPVGDIKSPPFTQRPGHVYDSAERTANAQRF